MKTRSFVFRDYVSTYQELRASCKSSRDLKNTIKDNGINLDSFESVYKNELATELVKSNKFAYHRLASELLWYRDRRPFFNVYPAIEKKFMAMSGQIEIGELTLPFNTIEIRTVTRTILVSELLDAFLFVFEQEDNQHEVMILSKAKTYAECLNVYNNIEVVDHNWPTQHTIKEASESDWKCALSVTVGACMLSNCSGFMRPVVLTEHRRENMTPEELERYAAKAALRTGRIGFEVGRELERMASTAHYRNGCFAKYYVSKKHESYPKHAEADKVPIIKWRSGTLVNKDNIPSIPTGYKDSLPEGSKE